MKLVITENQYNRLFNKPKTKLVISESQLRVLIVENMNKVIQQIQTGDKLKLVDKSGNELNFDVLDAFSGQILMSNKDQGVYKNMYFFITNTDLQGGNLQYRFIHKKDVDNTSLKSIISNVRDWKTSTFKNIKDFKISEKNDKPKFDVNPDTGAIEEPKPDNSKEERYNIEERLLDEVKDHFMNLKKGVWYDFIFNDNSKIPLKVLGFEGENIRFTEDGNFKFLETTDAKNMAEKNFKKLAQNINFKKANDLLIDTESIKVIDVIKPKKEGEDFRAIISFMLLVNGFNEEGKEIKTKFSIKGVTKVEEIKGMPSFKGGEEKQSEEEKDYEYTYEELKKKMESDEGLRRIIQTKPGAFVNLLGLVKKRGSLPVEDILNKWGVRVKNKDYGYFGKDFTIDTKPEILLKKENVISIYDTKDETLLNNLINELNNRGPITPKVSRITKGDDSIKLRGVVSNIKYELRLKKNGKSENTYIADLYIIENRTDREIKLAEVEFKVKDYKNTNK